MSEKVKAQLEIAIKQVGTEKLNLVIGGLGKTAKEADKVARRFEKLEQAERRLHRFGKAAGLTAHTKAIGQSVEKSTKKVGGFSDGFNRLLTVTSKMALVGYAIRGVMRTISAAVGGAIKPVMEFEKALAQVQIKGDNFSKLDMKNLAETAKQIGRTTMFRPTEAAEGAIELAASGLNAKQTTAALPAVLKFAQAADMSTDASAGLLVNTASQFGLNLDSPDSLMSVGNAIKAAADASTISERDLQHTLRYAGPQAHMAGQTVQETSAMAAVLGLKGLKASQAGTGLRNMYAALVKPKGGKRTQGMLKELGIDQEHLGQGLGDVPGLLGDIGQRIDAAGWGKAKKMRFTFSMFGQYGATAAQILMDSAKDKVEDGGTFLDSIIDNVRANTDALDKAAELREQTLEGKMRKVQARWETLWISVGERLLPHVSKALDGVIGKIEEWEKAAEQDPELAASFEAIGKAIRSIPEALEMALPLMKGFASTLNTIVETKRKFDEEAGGLFRGSREQQERTAAAAHIPTFKDGAYAGTAGQRAGLDMPGGYQTPSIKEQRGAAQAFFDQRGENEVAAAQRAAEEAEDTAAFNKFLRRSAPEEERLAPFFKPSEVHLMVSAEDGSKVKVSSIQKGAQDLKVSTNLP